MCMKMKWKIFAQKNKRQKLTGADLDKYFAHKASYFLDDAASTTLIDVKNQMK